MLARDESGFIQMAKLIHPVAWLDIDASAKEYIVDT